MTRAQRPRVLIVDDDAGLRQTLARVLGARFDVSIAANGADAVARVLNEAFDAVLTDLEMPELGGDGLVEWLEQNQPELAARVLVMTGGAKRADQAAWLAAFDGRRILRKPCPIGHVVAALEGLLARGPS